MKESQKLMDYFAQHGRIVQYKSNRKHLVGSVGQGIVMFQHPETAQNLINQNSSSLDLSSLYEKSDGSGSDDTSRKDWTVEIRTIEKSLDYMSLEEHLHRRKNTVTREERILDNYVQRLDRHFPGISRHRTTVDRVLWTKNVIASVLGSGAPSSRKVRNDT